MIEKRRNIHTPVCDGCGVELPEEYDFYDAIGAMKAAHWTFYPPTPGERSAWEHYCPECERLMARGAFE